MSLHLVSQFLMFLWRLPMIQMIILYLWITAWQLQTNLMMMHRKISLIISLQRVFVYLIWWIWWLTSLLLWCSVSFRFWSKNTNFLQVLCFLCPEFVVFSILFPNNFIFISLLHFIQFNLYSGPIYFKLSETTL